MVAFLPGLPARENTWSLSSAEDAERWPTSSSRCMWGYSPNTHDYLMVPDPIFTFRLSFVVPVYRHVVHRVVRSDQYSTLQSWAKKYHGLATDEQNIKSRRNCMVVMDNRIESGLEKGFLGTQLGYSTQPGDFRSMREMNKNQARSKPSVPKYEPSYCPLTPRISYRRLTHPCRYTTSNPRLAVQIVLTYPIYNLFGGGSFGGSYSPR